VATCPNHGFATGDRIRIRDVGGMPQVNDQIYTVDKLTDDTFAIDRDTTGYPAYTGGGTSTSLAENQWSERITTSDEWPVQATTTDPSGNYRFDAGLVSGRYFIREVLGPGWQETYVNPALITSPPALPLTTEVNYTVDFLSGTSPSGFDFGNTQPYEQIEAGGNGLATVTAVRQGILTVAIRPSVPPPEGLRSMSGPSTTPRS
jgi:hypothetical protein